MSCSLRPLAGAALVGALLLPWWLSGAVSAQSGLEYPRPCPGGCVPNAKDFGYFPRTWRQWPGEQRREQINPRSIGAEVLPTPQGQEELPLPTMRMPPAPSTLPDIESPRRGSILPPEPQTPGILPEKQRSDRPLEKPSDLSLPGLPGLPAESELSPPPAPPKNEPSSHLPRNSRGTDATVPAEFQKPATALPAQGAAYPKISLDDADLVKPEAAKLKPAQPAAPPQELLRLPETRNNSPSGATSAQSAAPDNVETAGVEFSPPCEKQVAPIASQRASLTPETVPPAKLESASRSSESQRPLEEPSPAQTAASSDAASSATALRPETASVSPPHTREQTSPNPTSRQENVVALTSNLEPERNASVASAYCADPIPVAASKTLAQKVEPAAYATAESSAPTANEATIAVPPVALGGYCPLELIRHGRWTQGDLRFTVVHGGRIYRLSGAEQRKQFLANPNRFVPANSGNDPVASVNEHREVPGQTNYCAIYEGRLYMFSSAATQAEFNQSPERYAEKP